MKDLEIVWTVPVEKEHRIEVRAAFGERGSGRLRVVLDGAEILDMPADPEPDGERVHGFVLDGRPLELRWAWSDPPAFVLVSGGETLASHGRPETVRDLASGRYGELTPATRGCCFLMVAAGLGLLALAVWGVYTLVS